MKMVKPYEYPNTIPELENVIQEAKERILEINSAEFVSVPEKINKEMYERRIAKATMLIEEIARKDTDLEKLTIEELEAGIKAREQRIFQANMADFLSDDDRLTIDICNREIAEMREKIAELKAPKKERKKVEKKTENRVVTIEAPRGAITYEDLERVNKKLQTIDIKGKAYVQVNTRILAFRELFPMGRITTDILSLDNGVCVMKATITDENGNVLASGTAYEKETSSYINKTSYIENCETSAVGRALAMLGIGTDSSMCSAEELVNAINNQQPNNQSDNQTKKEKATLPQKKTIKDICDEHKCDYKAWAVQLGTTWDDLDKETATGMLNALKGKGWN